MSYLSGFQGFNSAVIPLSPYTGARLPPPRLPYQRKIYPHFYPHVAVQKVRIQGSGKFFIRTPIYSRLVLNTALSDSPVRKIPRV